MKNSVIEKLLIEQWGGVMCKLVEIMWMSKPVDESKEIQSFFSSVNWVCVLGCAQRFLAAGRVLRSCVVSLMIPISEFTLWKSPRAVSLEFANNPKVSDTTSMTNDSKCALKSIILVFFTSLPALCFPTFLWLSFGCIVIFFLSFFLTLFFSPSPFLWSLFGFGCCLNSQIDFLTMCSFYTIFVSIFMRLMQSCFPCATLEYHKIYYFTTRIVRLLLLALVWAC